MRYVVHTFKEAMSDRSLTWFPLRLETSRPKSITTPFGEDASRSQSPRRPIIVLAFCYVKSKGTLY